MTAGAPRLLVLEDEWLIAADLEDGLTEAGCVVVGPAASVAEAMRLLAEHEVDAAVLDVNLTHEQSFPVAEHLIARGTPFVFVSGFVHSDLPERFRGCRMVSKPATPQRVLAALGVTVAADAAS